MIEHISGGSLFQSSEATRVFLTKESDTWNFIERAFMKNYLHIRPWLTATYLKRDTMNNIQWIDHISE